MTDPESRFNFASLIAVVDSGGELVENVRVDLPYPRPPITEQIRPDLYLYQVQPGDTLRGLAQRSFHGRSDLWWAICEFSGVIDPISEFKPSATTPKAAGTVLIPSFETVLFDLLNF